MENKRMRLIESALFTLSISYYLLILNRIQYIPLSMSRYSASRKQKDRDSILVVAAKGCAKQTQNQILVLCQTQCRKTSDIPSLQSILAIELAKILQQNVALSISAVEANQSTIKRDFYDEGEYEFYLELKASNIFIRLWASKAHYNQELTQWRKERIQDAEGCIINEETWKF